MAELPDSAEIVVIGGGVIGLSVAYHLAKLGEKDVILLERHRLTSGTSWHAAGIIGPLRASANLTHLSAYATELLPKIETETGQETGYRQTGGFWLAQTEDRMRELRRICDVGTTAGLHPEILTPRELSERSHWLNTKDLAGGMWVKEDGQANPVDVCMAYAKGAHNRGVRIYEGTGVQTVHTRDGSVTSVETVDGHTISCKKIVNCCGAWAKLLGQRSGVSIPLQAVEHMYLVTETVPTLPQPFPVIRDLEGRIYIKEDAGRLVLGGFEPNAKVWRPDSHGPDAPFLELDDDWDQFEPFMQAGLNRIPRLSAAGIKHFMTGPESFTPDTKQVMGEAPECRNYFVAAGFNSIGIISSAGAGKVMAEWVSDGACPLDIWDLDIARFEPRHSSKAFLEARAPEAVASQFEMHWPYKQMKTGRGLIRSPFHKAWAEQKAIFGAPTGFERPLYFGEAKPYSYGQQRWWPAVEREVAAMTGRAALLELTPFGKFLIEGRHALRFLQRICVSNMDIAPGRLIYTQMLNARGRIEADVTVTRIAGDRFLMVSGAATRIKDKAWLNRSLKGDHVAITDVTSDYAVLGVMGPEARTILSGLTPDNLSNDTFSFGSSREIELGHARIRASRVSYVGELGWELYIPREFADHVYEQLQPAGLQPMGLFAIDSCRMEKGYKHWGHDIGIGDTPIESGLSFTIDWDKPGGFTGRDAVMRQRQGGVRRRLIQFEAPLDPLLLHEEPVLRRRKHVGQTTSGARGFRTKKNLCFASIEVERGESLAATLADSYDVVVEGKTYSLTPLKKPPFDPAGRRMKA